MEPTQGVGTVGTRPGTYLPTDGWTQFDAIILAALRNRHYGEGDQFEDAGWILETWMASTGSEE